MNVVSIRRVQAIATSVNRTLHTSARLHDNGGQNRSNERNIFAEAAEEEQEELDQKSMAKGQSLLERQRSEMASQPAWDGEERVQDTILRMIVDKYKPITIKGGGGSGEGSRHPADVKMASVQKPAAPLSSTERAAREAAAASAASANQIAAAAASDLSPPDPDGRRLAKTPDNKPWRAVYVNPMSSGEEGKVEPQIYYAKYIGQASSSRLASRTASGKERLRMAGVKMNALPLDDQNKMRAIREGVRKWDRAGRMRGVKEQAMQYRRDRQEEREGPNEKLLDEDEIEALLNAEGVLKEGEEIRLSSVSDSESGEVQIGMMGGRGISSIANERIEAAMKTASFRQNSLRGKPLVRDVHASNPYLKGEERLMNRIVQRQGAAPPWVEMNVQVENEQNGMRKRLADSWLRRASRIILATAHLRDGLEPIGGIAEDAEFETLEQQSTLSDGQRKLLKLVNVYADSEWEQREQAYHEASLRDVNNLIRKYNIVAPVSTRRGLLMRQWELERVRKESRVALVRRLSSDLQPSQPINSSSSASPRSSSHAALSARHRGGIDSDAAAAFNGTGQGGSVGSGSRSSFDGVMNRSEEEASLRSKRMRSASNVGLADFVRRTAQRARQLVNW